MTSDDRKRDNSQLADEKQAWETMKLTYTGEAKDLIQHGTAKISQSPGDPGEVDKVPNH